MNNSAWEAIICQHNDDAAAFFQLDSLIFFTIPDGKVRHTFSFYFESMNLRLATKRRMKNVMCLLNNRLGLIVNNIMKRFMVIKTKTSPNYQQHPCSYSVWCHHASLHCWLRSMCCNCFLFNSLFVCKASNSAAAISFMYSLPLDSRCLWTSDFSCTHKFHNSCE